MTPVAPLHFIAQVVRGVSFDKGEAASVPGDGTVPVLRAGNIDFDLRLDRDLVWVPQRRVSAVQLMRPGDIAICMSSGSAAVVGKTAILRSDWHGSVGAFCAIVRPDQAKVLPEYLAYFLQSDRFREWTNQSSGANIKNIRKTELEAFTTPVPPIEEQRRIVDILSRAEGIVRLRREAETKAKAIIPTLFIDMFGDPATNSMGWDLVQLGSVGSLDRGRSRHRPRDAAELYDGPYPFIQTGDVANSGGRISRYKSTYSEIGLRQSRLWPKGTLCITIAANIAKTGVLEFDACFPDSVVGFVPGENVTNAYVQAWLHFLQPTLEANAPQAAQKNINLEILRNLPIPVPPMDLQQSFEERAKLGLCVERQQATALLKAEAAFAALLSRTFSAEPA